MSISNRHQGRPGFLSVSLSLACSLCLLMGPLSIALSAASGTALLVGPSALAAGNWYDNENTFLDRGKRDYNSGQFDQAIQELTQGIRANSSRPDLFYWRSLSYSAIHQNDLALNDLNDALRIDPSNAACYLSRGLMYSNQNKYELAVADFDAALKNEPGLIEARQNRDYCLKEMQKGAAQTQVAAAEVPANVVNLPSSSTSTSTSTSTAAAGTISAFSGKSYGYSPYTGKANLDPKTIALQKEQKEIEAKLLHEKNEASRVEADRLKAVTLQSQLAFKLRQQDAHLEAEKAKRDEASAHKLASAKVASAGSARGAKSEIKVEVATAPKTEAKPEHKIETETDALEVVNRPVRDKWALIIGISEFADKNLNLHYPAKDAKDFAEFLVKEGNFSKDHVKLLVNQDATRGNILSALGDKWLPHVANPDDLVLIYISSHGSSSEMDNNGVNYLLAYDSQVDNLYASGLPMQDLTRTIKARVHSDRVVLVLDACHSGAAEAGGKGLNRSGNVDAAEVAQGTGQLVISSSNTAEISWESKKYQNSVFTRCLIESLRQHGNATTLGEAFDNLHNTVREQVLLERGVLQEPILKSKWKGLDLRISVPPSSPRPGI